MSYFLLPSIPYNLDLHNLVNQTYNNDDSKNSIVINKTLSDYLYKIKCQIDTKQQEWDRYKKYTFHMNIHTIARIKIFNL